MNVTEHIILGRPPEGVRDDSVPNARVYNWHGDAFPSVTSILNRGVPKPALVQWAARSVAEAAITQHKDVSKQIRAGRADAAFTMLRQAPWQQRDRAAQLGTSVHEYLEAIVLGRTPSVSDEAAPYIRGFEAFLADRQPEYLASEVMVINRTHCYAGTLDAIIAINGCRYVLDYKTGKGVYPETALQLAAYRYAEALALPDGTEMPQIEHIDRGLILHLLPTGEYVLHETPAGPRAFNAFLAARRMAEWLAEPSPLSPWPTQPFITGQGN